MRPLIAAALAALHVARLASAADWPAPGASGECAIPAVPQPAASPKQQVEGLYRQFECRFLRGEYGACLPYLERACSMQPSPRCSFNLAAVHHALMHCELAGSYYREYLDALPYEPDGDAARRALDELAATCDHDLASLAAAKSRALPVPVQAHQGAPRASGPVIPPLGAASLTTLSVQPHPSPEAQQRLVAGWLLGAGAASGALTALALVHGARADRDAERRDRENGALALTQDPELQAIDRAGRRHNQLAVGFGITSAVLLGAGVTFWLWSGGSAGVGVGSGGAPHVTYGASF